MLQRLASFRDVIAFVSVLVHKNRHLSFVASKTLSISVTEPRAVNLLFLLQILNKFSLIKFVVCTNTMGNALIIDPNKEEPIIAPKGGFGGLAGGYVKQVQNINYDKCNLTAF